MASFINNHISFSGIYINNNISSYMCGVIPPSNGCNYPPPNTKFTITDNLWFTPNFPGGNIKIDLLNTNYSPLLLRWQSQQYTVTNQFIANNNGICVGTWFLDIHPRGTPCPEQVYLLIQGCGYPNGSQIKNSNNVVWLNNISVCYIASGISIGQNTGGFYTWGDSTQQITPISPYAVKIPISGVVP